MATHERRRKLTIEEVNVYWRALKEGSEKPSLQRVCNAIRSLDLALGETDTALCSRLSANAWSRERDDFFDFLVSSFPGYFVAFAEGSDTPLDAEFAWPVKGTIEFFPEMGRRRDDAFRADFEKIHASLVIGLRCCFAEVASILCRKISTSLANVLINKRMKNRPRSPGCTLRSSMNHVQMKHRS